MGADLSEGTRMGPKVSRSSLNPVEMDRISTDRSSAEAAAAAVGSDRLASRREAPSSIAIRGWIGAKRELAHGTGRNEERSISRLTIRFLMTHFSFQRDSSL
jgi:hypothetical protein